MQSFMDMLTELMGPFGPLIAVGGLGLLLVLLTLPMLLKKQKDPLDRLKEQARAPKPGAPEARLRAETKKDKLEKYSDFLEPKDAEEFSAVKLKLLQAGYRGRNAVRMYHFAQFALGGGGLILGTAYALLLQVTQDPSTQQIILSILVPGAVGYLAPKYWVNRRLQSRQEEITNGFPDSLDMMLVCVEAGQSLDQAILRVSREIKAGYPALAEEFSQVSQEMKAGKDRISVLRDMSERAGVTDVASFVTVLIQSASFGTSIAEALRVFSAEMRDKRVMRAEEKANTLPTKMTLATMMLTVPPLLIILVGPSVYGIYDTLTGQSTGF
ncbi:type II secretion system F family protein [Psychromarinibacter sp. C21-152]|uniref:Type II secretion system F family protein n=1 Tax=Psychromarinibacter sediminicola TaxID=3033385 RepID=A0AAE3NPN0_9RHOB|nr:type II secretion system F family protein [Psychromarinibacter sediminicola]MDF0599801.1 type II secretion system F family protein [Psychromarinibacter sediminicola]